MRLLFTIDRHDYDECTRTFVRDSARSIIIRDGRVAMIHSMKYGYYKFPGGGIREGEYPVLAMIRETREEAGLLIVPESIREYGYVHRVQKSDSDPDEVFIQDNYYYLCSARSETVPQELDDYEAEEGFTLEFVDPHEAIRKNVGVGRSPYNGMMFEREVRVLKILIREKYLK